MKRLITLAVTALLTSASAYAQDAAIGSDATCTRSGLPNPAIKIVNNLQVWVSPMAVVRDPAVDDSGLSGPGDDLQFFCVLPRQDSRLGRIAACLSKEQCPWR